MSFLMFDIIFFAILSFVIFNKIKGNLGKTDEIKRKESIRKFIKENINQTKQKNFPKIIEFSKVADEDLSEIEDIETRTSTRKVLKKSNTKYKSFISGAEISFDMVTKSLNSKDKESVKILFSEKIYPKFCDLVDGSQGVNRHIELISIKKAEIKEAKIEGNFALIQVDFLSEQINFTYNDNDELLEGSRTEEVEVENLWVFKKDCNSKNPNWIISSMRMIEGSD
jgi:predicted lipid-binding transport protein (Tim44 family)